MTNKEIEGLDFSPEYNSAESTGGRSRPVKSFTLSKNVSDKLDKLKRTSINGKRIKVSDFVDNAIKQAFEQSENAINFTGNLKGYAPVTLMVREEIAEFINALLLSGGAGLPCAKSRTITPYTLGQRLSEIIANPSMMLLAGDMSIKDSAEFEIKMANAKESAKDMMNLNNV